MICAIHQPNFFPWLGYFDKIVRADVFVFMDDVDYPKSGHSMASWCNRVAVADHGKAARVSCPLIRMHGPQTIKDVQINNRLVWRDSVVNMLRQAYAKSDYYRAVADYIYALIEYETQWLSAYNIESIRRLMDALGIQTKCVLQSELHTAQASTALLVEITKLVNCDTYLCGGGTSGYQDDEMFFGEEIRLLYQDFCHPEYRQTTEAFLPGMSVLDLIFNYGFSNAGEIIRDNAKKERE